MLNTIFDLYIYIYIQGNMILRIRQNPTEPSSALQSALEVLLRLNAGNPSMNRLTTFHHEFLFLFKRMSMNNCSFRVAVGTTSHHLRPDSSCNLRRILICRAWAKNLSDVHRSNSRLKSYCISRTCGSFCRWGPLPNPMVHHCSR